jgi:Anti-sigma-K factor rskA
MSMTDDDDHLARLLADPSLWLEPDSTIEMHVLDAVRAERPAGQATVTSLPNRRRSWSSHIAAAALGAAAAALVAFAVTRSTNYADDDQTTAADLTAQLRGTDLAPGFVGSAAVTTESSGVLIRLTMPGLPRREGHEFYEGWLKSCDGSRLVPIGTFHDMDRAAGWAGVSVVDYPLLTVTAEQAAGPTDPEQGSSGQVVVSGTLSPCPAP